MSDHSAPRPEARSAPAVLASMPWIVVLLGVGLLAVLLVFALLSFRGPEQPPAPEPAPPMYLPRMPSVTSSVTPPGDAPLVAVDATPSGTASGTPSPRASTHRPTATPTTRAPAAASGRVSADYQATSSDRDSFSARLTVRNTTGGAREWRVELLFTGNVKSIRASSDSGLSVRTKGTGWFVLTGTRPLPAGESAVVSMTFGRTGTGDQPGQCTVNGADCTIG
ncbi:Cellulose binding domain-containing protein [Micromonospora purpureochromogenes]|uniref:Cellulose binding domain-containing protein n=1 Tax=Micromonospora purpureochromogenes TaxID=47872 RepID=A0A1C4XFK8_9ACTN|nr:cellulose binding domain-containing protein [Micromonospora purpureochromogenes]SCF07142.1 Cellulose binding domain-containing protein [Micromonospora purpureochromogenes]